MIAVSMHLPAAHALPALDNDDTPLRTTPTNSSTGRPKLSLQTSALTATYGVSTASKGFGDSLNTAVTPTTLNTFNNTYDLSIRPSPSSATTSPATKFPFSPSTRTTTSNPKPRSYPVNLPFGIRPILKNGPRSIRRENITTASPRNGTRRTFFPASKRVTFRSNLEDEITNTKYLTRHSDIVSSEDEVSSSDNDSHDSHESVSVESEENSENSDDSLTSNPHKRLKPELGLINTDEVDIARGRSSRKRPNSARRMPRKRRRWEWTLGSVDRQSNKGLAAQRHAIDESALTHPHKQSTRDLEPEETPLPDSPEPSGSATPSISEASSDDDSPSSRHGSPTKPAEMDPSILCKDDET